jgi:hypothetical protein
VLQVVEQIQLEEKGERPDMEQLARATIGKFFNRQEYCKPMLGGPKGGPQHAQQPSPELDCLVL